MNTDFSLTEYPLPNGTVVEASAGTGKTYSVAAHVTLAIATDRNLRIGDILITTYTRNAVAELRDRVRGRMVATAQLLRECEGSPKDDLDSHLLNLLTSTEDDRLERARRLERAVAEFDTATIATIHGVCSKVLKVLMTAGSVGEETGEDELGDRILAEVVNDQLLSEAIAGRPWDQSRILALVRAALHDPFIVPWFNETGLDEARHRGLVHVRQLVERCVGNVRQAMRATPSFDDLLRLAWEAVKDPARESLRLELRERFKLAIVDEAQDTSRLQWEFFHELFPPDGSWPMIAVGDPKQAIYGFRGADVQAYLRFSQGGAGPRSHRTLSTNRRSDKPLLDTLNKVLHGASFGPGIAYHEVHAAAENATSRIVGRPPVEFIDLGDASLAQTAARKVLELLASSEMIDHGHTKPRRVRANDVCVLVRANAVGQAIEQWLSGIGIRAVSTGTASVMHGQMADDIRAVLEAMERPSHSGRVRRAAATAFFGHEIASVASLAEDDERAVQERIAQLSAVLHKQGIAACAAEIAADAVMMGHLTAGADGERTIADLAHIVEILHRASDGKGVTAQRMLELFAELHAKDEKSELVSRRVESDEDAVKIMTVHSAKGLEFPCVIVADAWKLKDRLNRPAVFYDGDTRRLDIAFADPDIGTSDAAKAAVLADDNEELRRLLYVALTRPKHHLCVLVMPTAHESILTALMPGLTGMRSVGELPRLEPLPQAATAAHAAATAVAVMPGQVVRTYRRTSFSAIAAARSRAVADPVAPEGRGFDERPSDPMPSDERPLARTPAVDGFTIAELPAGTAVGSVVHEILERIDTGCVRNGQTLKAEVRRVVDELATSNLLQSHHDTLANMITSALQTPFGGLPGTPCRDVCFADIAPEDRLTEMDFEMALASFDCGVLASDIGRLLSQVLSPGDLLHGYAEALALPAFDIPLAGLINGSIDVVLRLPGSTPEFPRLVIADYKTNKLHTRDMARPMDAYSPAGLVDAMAEHHYPLQAVVYGTAVYRMLRWRLRRDDPADCIAAIVYGFIRGMKGPATPSDSDGRRYGVFTWQPPPGLWARLSSLLTGNRTGVGR